jgi:hypothetical protein
VTTSEHDRLRREASGLKVRAMRLRALGDEQDQWDAILLLHEAARKELAALAQIPQPSDHEQTSARVEACGLFLDSDDPVRAGAEWASLPRWAFTSDAGALMVARLKPAYASKFSAFSRDWRKNQEEPGRSPDLQRIQIKQLRKLAETYPGVAEFWWALSSKESDIEEARLAREKMRQLDSTLEESAVAVVAWDRIGQVLASKLKLALHSERPGSVLMLDVVGRIQSAFGELLDGFAERVFGDSVDLIPQGAKLGSFILDISVHGLRPYALEALDSALTNNPKGIDGRKLVELVELLSQNGIRLAVSVVDSVGDTSETAVSALVIDARRGRALLKAVESTSTRTIDSADIPQADDINRVFTIVERIALHEEVSAETIGITKRQVDYYRRAAKILGLVAESDELTAAGRLIARLGVDDRLRTTVVYFESSICGDAWIRWSEGKTLLDVTPETAVDFLLASVPGLSEDTARRRAVTLSAWYRILIQYHYAA